jgi:hypothetical protein
MNKQQELLVQGTERLMKGFSAEVKEVENPEGSVFKYMFEVVVEHSVAFKPIKIIWVEMMNLVANAFIIHENEKIVVGVTDWKSSSEVKDVDALINAAIRNSIMARTAKITNLQRHIGETSDELEDISSLIGRV